MRRSSEFRLILAVALCGVASAQTPGDKPQAAAAADDQPKAGAATDDRSKGGKGDGGLLGLGGPKSKERSRSRRRSRVSEY
jgi:hypothetical protein